MAVIGRCESGFLVDHQKSISETVSSLSLSCKEALFALYDPYYRTSTEGSSDTKATRKRKRKKSAQVSRSQEELDADLQHHKVRETIATGVERLIQIGMDKGCFLCGNECVDQITIASVLPKGNKDFAGLLSDEASRTRMESKHVLEPFFIKGENVAVNQTNLLDRVISHQSSKPTVINIAEDKYILPANCTFLMSDASNLQPLISYAQNNGLYNLVVLDPPWYNKSARRGSKYSFMSLWQIKSLPVPQLLAPGALVGVWVTNKQKYIRFTKTELFPHWSIELVAEWYWVKVTRRGELVTNLDSPHKKPYEPLFLGRFTAKMDSLRNDFCMNIMKSSESTKERTEFTYNKTESEVLGPQEKRKKFNEDDDDVEDEGIRKICYTSYDNLAHTQKQSSSLSTRKPNTDLICVECVGGYNGQLNKFSDTVPTQSSKKHCINCHKLCHKNKVDLSDNMESFSDAVVHKEQYVDEVIHENKRFHEFALDLNFVQNVQETKFPMNSTSEHFEPLTRDVMPRDCGLLPYHQIICSVPCKIHSRKPSLNEILSQYVPHDALCLEMFARNLTPHWTSWGNEVLRFQNMEYFDQLLPKQELKETIAQL